MQQLPGVPTPPNPPDPNRIGEQVEQAVRGAVSGLMGQGQLALEAHLQTLLARREGLLERLDRAPRSERAGLQRDLERTNADIRDVRRGLEEIAEARQEQLQGASASRGTPAQLPPPPDQVPQDMIIGVVAIMFIGFPLALTFARILWRRASGPPAPPAISAEQARRFDRLEQSVDAIAIEIERISENQRYLTRVLGESRQPVGLPGKAD